MPSLSVLTSDRTVGVTTGATTASVATTADTIQLLCVGATPESTAPAEIQVPGWQPLTARNYNPGDLNRFVAVFQRVGTGTSISATINTKNNAQYQELRWVWLECADVSEVRQAVSAIGNSGTPSVTLGAFGNASNATLQIIASASGLNPTVGTGYTQLAEVQGTVQGDFLTVGWQNANDTSVDASGTGSDFWGILGLELVAGTYSAPTDKYPPWAAGLPSESASSTIGARRKGITPGLYGDGTDLLVGESGLFLPSSGTSGSASITLGALTCSGAGVLPIAASGAVTLGALTMSSVGAVAVRGQTASPLAALTLAAAGGAPPVTGDAAVTLAAMATVSAGSVSVRGQASATLEALTVVASSVVALRAALAKTLDALAVSSTGTLAIKGAASIALGDALLTAQSALAARGGASVTLGSLALVSQGALVVRGQTGVALEALLLLANGALTADGSGSAAIALGALQVGAVGALPLRGVAGLQLASLSLGAAGVLPATGGAAIQLGPLALTAAGGLSLRGQGVAVLDPLVLAAGGRTDVAATLAITLGDLVLSAAGVELVVVRGAARIGTPIETMDRRPPTGAQRIVPATAGRAAAVTGRRVTPGTRRRTP